MTQEDKDLLVKDLCARLSYGVKCYAYQYKIDGNHCECYGTLTGLKDGYFYLSDRESINGGKTHDERYLEVKPYLRPMSSITEKEREELQNIINKTLNRGQSSDDEYVPWCLYDNDGIENLIGGERFYFNEMCYVYDFLNARHLDYRGLIPKGIALEAKEGMYAW